MATESDSPQSVYELIRIVMIDSYTTGRITELPIAGGTAITGRNGGGKTSLLKLIPAFYGERTDRIIRPVSNQQNFARYYLPRGTSYIVYEYRREERLCCVVLCSEGDSVQYRFVSSAYQRSWFVHDDERSLVANANLLERLKLHGAPCTRKMSLDQYRPIIQGKRVHGSDLKQHRRDVLEYAFCPSGQPLLHIERLVFGMFTRQANFKDLQRMVVATVTDATGQISLGAERKRVESWPDAFDSYERVMREAEKVESIELAYNDTLAAEQELRNIHARFISLDEAIRTEEVKTNLQLQEARDAKATAEQTFSEQRREIAERVEQAARTIAALDKTIDLLHQQKNQFDEQKIEKKAALVDREAEIIAANTRFATRKSLLLDKLSGIEGEYAVLIADVKLDQAEGSKAFDVERRAASEAYQAEIERLMLLGEQEEAAERAAARPAEKELEQAIEAASEAVGIAKGRMNDPRAESHLQDIAERQQEAVNETRQKLDAAQTEASAALRFQVKAQEHFNRGEAQVRSAQMELAQAEAGLKALIAQAIPDENSLLHFLRTQHPDWTDDIAKVLREDLLLRTDLGPALNDVRESIYGLQIKLDALDVPAAADEALLQERIEARRNEISSRRELSATLEAQLVDLSAKHYAAAQQANLLNGLASTAKATLESAGRLLKSARSDVARSVDQAREAARGEHGEAVRACDSLKAQLVAGRVKLDDNVGLVRVRRDAAKLVASRCLDQILKQIAEKEREAAVRFELTLGKINQERITKLRDGGVDTAALAALEDDLKTVQEQLRAINSTRNAVLAWRRWVEVDWSQLAAHQEARENARREKGIHDEAKLACDKAAHENVSRYNRQIQEIDQQLSDFDDQRTKVRKQCQNLEAFVVQTHQVPAYDPAWKLTSLVGQVSVQLGSRRASEERMSRDVRALKSAFTESRNSPPDQYFDIHRKAMGPDRAEQAREWVPVFRAWYTTEHLHDKNLLQADARLIAQAIGEFRNRMESFHLRVQQFNRELQANLNANEGFESIGQLSVEIVSTIRELGYWSTIEKVVEEQSRWEAGALVDLPQAGFASALRELLSHWNLKEGIQAELMNLIRIQGDVVENDTRRPFRKDEDLVHISSNGLSYIIMVLIFVGFINRVRGTAAVNVTWALDEIKDLDLGNVELLMKILRKNNITLVSACPDPDPDVLILFKNRRSLKKNRMIYDPSGAIAAALPRETEQEGHDV